MLKVPVSAALQLACIASAEDDACFQAAPRRGEATQLALRGWSGATRLAQSRACSTFNAQVRSAEVVTSKGPKVEEPPAEEAAAEEGAGEAAAADEETPAE